MIVSAAVPDAEQAKICLLEVFRNGDCISRDFKHHRVIARSTEGNGLSRAVHVVVHGLRIFYNSIETQHVDLIMPVYFHRATAYGLGPNIIRQVTCPHLELTCKGLPAVLRENLVGRYVSLYLCLIVIGNIGSVREAMMVGTQFKGKPVLVISGIVDIPVDITTTLVIIVLFFKDLHAGNVLLISRDIRIRKGIVRHTGTVNDGLGNVLSIVVDGLRCITRVKLSRNQGANFGLPGLSIFYIDTVAQAVFLCEAQLI